VVMRNNHKPWRRNKLNGYETRTTGEFSLFASNESTRRELPMFVFRVVVLRDNLKGFTDSP